MRTGINNRDIVRDDVSVNRKRLLTNDTPFATKEAYVKLRTSLMFCMTSDKTRPCKVFAVTSAKPSEGKSITASNIAISYAMLGKKRYSSTRTSASLRCGSCGTYLRMSDFAISSPA